MQRNRGEVKKVEEGREGRGEGGYASLPCATAAHTTGADSHGDFTGEAKGSAGFAPNGSPKGEGDVEVAGGG